MRIQSIDYSTNITQSLLWQYNEAIHLQSLVEQKQTWYDVNQSQFWSDWFHDVFDLQSANEFGLNVWSIILNIPIQLGLPINLDKPIFGFNQDTPINDYTNFDNGNFVRVNGQISFTGPQKRLLLRLRYFQLTTRCDVLDINRFLKFVFAEPDLNYGGDVYVLDGLDMSITYVFTEYLPPELVLMFTGYDILPRPEGVLLKIVVPTGKIFGFGDFNQNFGNGNFMELI